jgi:dihydropteroate synthase
VSVTFNTDQKPAASPPVFVCGRFALTLDRPRIMGVVNVTPDSFSDGGQYLNPALAIAHAADLVAQGADILDVGGESTRPGAAPVSVEQELQRVLPVLQGVMGLGVPISIDTRRPQVMRAAVDLGVDIINDVNGFRDPDSVSIAAASGCGLCIMHMLGEPQTMQQAPHYQDVVAEVSDFLFGQRDLFVRKGVSPDRILLDPGFGFGKQMAHNMSLMRAISQLASTHPILVGVSRKSMVGALSGEPQAADRLGGSVAAALWAAAQGAQVLRVHDVKATAQAFAVWQSLSGNV